LAEIKDAKIKKTMKVAFVYDRVNKIGGAERVLEALHQLWPKAPLYTAVYYPPGAPWSAKFKVIPSFLNKFPFAQKHHELYPWLTPLAFESFDFSDFDLVVSVTSAEAKGILTKPGTKHLCYCLTPTRYLWSSYEQYFPSRFLKTLSQPLVKRLREWDKVASQRPDVYLAISKTVQKRIKKYYQRDAQVVYPPVGTDKFFPAKTKTSKDHYFLVVSRLVPYKKIDLVVEAFNQLGWPLKIIGTGSEMLGLKKMAQKNIEFLEQLTDKDLLSYYQNCRALLFPQVEDFGLVSLEAQACGKPVIAFSGGGALETVVEGKTGTFFKPQTAAALIKKMKEFDEKKYQADACRQNAQRFDQKTFLKNFYQQIEKII